MIYTIMVNKALNVCYSAHKDQVDKSGVPYVFHPYHLAEQFDEEDYVVTALLHDVVEDTSRTIEDLKWLGFNDNVITAVELLTHDKEVPYEEYVKKLSTNPIAKAVKIKDLEHNMDASRLLVPNPSRYLKYKKAYDYLTN